MSIRTALRRALHFLAFLAALLVSSVALCQGMQLIRPGPFGRPLLVRDEGNSWVRPISVYSDHNLELFVSENLTLAGVAWDWRAFKKDGTYATYLYTFYKNSHDCIANRIPMGHASDPEWQKACSELRYQRRLILVDTRKKTVTIRQALLMEGDGQPHPELMGSPNVTIPLNGSVNPALFHAVTRITSMIEFQISRHPEWRESQGLIWGAQKDSGRR